MFLHNLPIQFKICLAMASCFSSASSNATKSLAMPLSSFSVAAVEVKR